MIRAPLLPWPMETTAARFGVSTRSRLRWESVNVPSPETSGSRVAVSPGPVLHRSDVSGHCGGDVSGHCGGDVNVSGHCGGDVIGHCRAVLRAHPPEFEPVIMLLTLLLLLLRRHEPVPPCEDRPPVLQRAVLRKESIHHPVHNRTPRYKHTHCQQEPP